MAALGALISAMAPWPWPMAGVALSTTMLLVILHVNFLKPYRRRRALRRPVEAFFLVPGPGRDCDYAEQDGHEHWLREIVLPANAEIIAELIYKARLAFHTRDVSFGCEHVSGSADRPRAIEYSNPFIVRGRRQRVVPGEGNDDYQDTHGYFHAVENKLWSAGDEKSYAIKNPRSKLRGIGGSKEADQKHAASCGEYVPKEIQGADFRGGHIRRTRRFYRR